MHISALGADAGVPTAFARTCYAGDAALMARDLDWVILRPSVVTDARPTAAARCCAGLLPCRSRLRCRAGELQVVQLDDLVRTVAFFPAPAAPGRLVLDLVGPERLSFAQVVRSIAAGFGWREAPLVRLPAWTPARHAARGPRRGLGWRSPLRSTARLEIMRGSVGSPAEWTRIVGIVLRFVAAFALAARSPRQRRSAVRAALPRQTAAAHCLRPVLDRDGHRRPGYWLGRPPSQSCRTPASRPRLRRPSRS